METKAPKGEEETTETRPGVYDRTDTDFKTAFESL